MDAKEQAKQRAYEADVRFRHERLKARLEGLEASVKDVKHWLANVEAEAKSKGVDLTKEGEAREYPKTAAELYPNRK